MAGPPSDLPRDRGSPAGADRRRSAEQRSQRHRQIASGVETSRRCRARWSATRLRAVPSARRASSSASSGSAIVHQLGDDLPAACFRQRAPARSASRRARSRARRHPSGRRRGRPSPAPATCSRAFRGRCAARCARASGRRRRAPAARAGAAPARNRGSSPPRRWSRRRSRA